MNILIVDDDPTTRKIMEKIISNQGFYKLVDNGSDALEEFKLAWQRDIPFDIIFLDIHMPGIDGIDVLRCIRHSENEKKLSKTHQVIIIMMTSTSDKKTVVACRDAGCDDYLLKPIDDSKVFEKLKNHGFDIDQPEILSQNKKQTGISSL